MSRAILAFARDDENDCFVISQEKNSYGRIDLPSLEYQIESETIDTPSGPVDTGKLVFTGHSSRSVREILAHQSVDRAPARTEAEEFLRDYLKDGPQPVPSIKEEARCAGITDSALRKARIRICQKPKKLGMSSGWCWALESDPSKPLEDAEGDPFKKGSPSAPSVVGNANSQEFCDYEGGPHERP